MTMIRSKNILLEDVYVNSTDTKQAVGFEFSCLNHKHDFYTGLGVATGSMRQYDGFYRIVENDTARNITINNMRYDYYFKTWTGISSGYPPNGEVRLYPIQDFISPSQYWQIVLAAAVLAIPQTRPSETSSSSTQAELWLSLNALHTIPLPATGIQNPRPGHEELVWCHDQRHYC
ncbi:hypothetical protein AC578_10822 [Pseudocercospora eumusae]|uniref:Uncharacterized protein n=1 Tax=Pseudocercospora eumusae TaxID=321146 RepID=A0A139GVV1_9PEZI|nr:hypothetical protein AC578_10822 [Pseudocercospora eumusae]